MRRENDPSDHFLILLVLDGAGWHGANALVVPDNLSLLTLPPYCPELNPPDGQRAEPAPPKPHRFMADLDAPLVKQVLHVAQGQWEPNILNRAGFAGG